MKSCRETHSQGDKGNHGAACHRPEQSSSLKGATVSLYRTSPRGPASTSVHRIWHLPHPLYPSLCSSREPHLMSRLGLEVQIKHEPNIVISQNHPEKKNLPPHSIQLFLKRCFWLESDRPKIDNGILTNPGSNPSHCAISYIISDQQQSTG